MSRTRRDERRRFWNTHFDLDNDSNDSHWNVVSHRNDFCHVCASRAEAWRWARPYRHEDGVPSAWNRSQRREERAHVTNMMRRARSGHLDWDDFPAGNSKVYRRPYYW